MAKCSQCHENEAMFYLHRTDSGETERLCARCAWERKEPQLENFFVQAGVNEHNIDEFTEQNNRLIASLGDMASEFLSQIPGDLPTQLLKAGEALRAAQEAAAAKGDPAADSSAGEGTDMMLPAEVEEEDDESEGEEAEDPSSKPPSQPFVFGDMGQFWKMLQGSDGGNFNEMMNRILGDMQAMMLGGEEGLMAVGTGGEADPAKEEERRRAAGRRGRVNSSGRQPKKLKYLDQFGRNLTLAAEEGELDPLIGREKELNRVIQILNRRTKNNPVLLGEPGVGKSAIANGLAERIAAGAVPVKLQDMQVYLVDMTALVAGTQFRGQFEARMKGLVDEAKSCGNIILVIDELHNIMGAGDAEGSMNAANILKPALASGEIRILGATTLKDYRRFIERDSALERRFQQVIIDEPDQVETVVILKGLRPLYEKHHHVIIPDPILEYAVSLAERYITERFQPDKSVDLIDEAGSQANLNNSALVELMRQIEDLDSEVDSVRRELATYKVNSNEPDDHYYELTAKERMLGMQIEDLRGKLAEVEPVTLTREDIAAVVEMWTGIPVRKITESEAERLAKLEDRLHERVIGQDRAVSALARAIRRHRAGLGKRGKPASFIFVGPTGVGKTELVKALAEVLFADEKNLIRLDMSEYMEAHTVSKLIGSPPGYIGYDESGQLTEKVRRNPYSVLLFDEIEKAHADVFNMLLQILDDGRLTDSHGRVVDFSHTVVVLTSNAGTSIRATSFGFSEQKSAADERIHAVLKETFRPEFLNRIDEIVIFDELSREEIREIAALMIKQVNKSLENRKLTLVVTDAALDYLAAEGYSREYGARPLRRTIQRMVEDPLADKIIAGELEGKIGVSVDYSPEENKLIFDSL